MCGIVGLVGDVRFAGSFDALLDSLAHRGPDARGTFEDCSSAIPVKLGHCRLSIIDLSESANQPFEKDGLVLVFNGEIYNFAILRRQIESHGVTFRTQSDTEVLLEAWRLWGPDCLPRLRGMFAFAVYDREDGRLVLARDPFGIKPLFLLRRGSGLAFASELKGLLPVLGPGAVVDETGIIASLIYGWLPDDFAMYRDIAKLGSGQWLDRRRDGTLSIHQYWNPATQLNDLEPAPFQVDDLRAALQDSVAAHMIADVPVATFLSGGLDSSLISVLARKHADRLDCFTIAFRPEDQKFEQMPDDLRYARQVAKRYDLTLHEITIEPDLARMLPEMADILDEPIGDPAAINAYIICKEARELGIKVLLSGMGADELFAGYRRHYACLLARRYRKLPMLLRAGLVEPLIDLLPAASSKRGYRLVRWTKRFLSFAGLDEEAAFQRSYALLSLDEISSALNDGFSSAVERVFSHHAAIYAQGAKTDPINRMCRTDVQLFLPGLNLAYTDRASMAASTEVRVPFVDTEIVQAAFRLSGVDKIRGKNGKLALKKAAEAWLPASIVYRPKGLFSAPLRAWIRNDLRSMVDDIVPDGELVHRGYLKSAYLRQLIADDRAGKADHSKNIWHLLTMEFWLRGQRTRSYHGYQCQTAPALN